MNEESPLLQRAEESSSTAQVFLRQVLRIAAMREDQYDDAVHIVGTVGAENYIVWANRDQLLAFARLLHFAYRFVRGEVLVAFMNRRQRLEDHRRRDQGDWWPCAHEPNVRTLITDCPNTGFFHCPVCCEKEWGITYGRECKLCSDGQMGEAIEEDFVSVSE